MTQSVCRQHANLQVLVLCRPSLNNSHLHTSSNAQTQMPEGATLQPIRMSCKRCCRWHTILPKTQLLRRGCSRPRQTRRQLPQLHCRSALSTTVRPLVPPILPKFRRPRSAAAAMTVTQMTGSQGPASPRARRSHPLTFSAHDAAAVALRHTSGCSRHHSGRFLTL